ncbi:MAG: dTMP kinase [Defluviitaleaceae bacterium]|nr:dTMP kinase [Defluviitaleaceae bacterium]
MLISIEGIDGAGKTTQVNMLSDFFRTKLNKMVYITKQPTNFYRSYDRFKSYIYGKIDTENSKILYELALIAATDKLRHYETEILHNESDIIISDRYIHSTYAYFLARGIEELVWLKEINKFLPMPQFTFYLDINIKEALSRIIKRDNTITNEEKNLKTMSFVRDNFILQPWGISENYYIIDGGGINNSPEKIHENIVQIILNNM